MAEYMTAAQRYAAVKPINFGTFFTKDYPKPAVKKQEPTANERAASPTNNKPLTIAEMQQAIKERQEGAQKVAVPIQEVTVKQAMPEKVAIEQQTIIPVNSRTVLSPLTRTGLNNAIKIAALPSNTGLFSGDLVSYQNRKKWVQDHIDYLKEKGANINWDNYSGTAEQNLALKRLLGGFDEWNVAKQKAAVPVMSPSQKFVQTGYTSGRPWQDAELQNMEGSHALYLNPTDYNRWMQIQLGKTKPVAYVAPATPVLNADAPRTDIYNRATAVSPRTQVNPIIAAPEQYEIGSGPITPEVYFKMYPYKASQEFTIVGSTPTFHLKDYYSAKKNGGKINYQKIFK